MELAGIPWSAIGALTPAGLLSIGVLLIFTGKLIPSKSAEREYATLKESRDYWREAAHTAQQTASDAAKALAANKDTAESFAKIMDAIKSAQGGAKQ